jgi:hypothetical protein
VSLLGKVNSQKPAYTFFLTPSLDTTARYTRVATGMIANIKSPLDLLSQPRKKPKKNPGKKPDIGENDQPPA